MGLLDWRKRKIAESAKEHMQPGEEARAMAMSQTAPSWLTGSAASKVHAVVATDDNLYILRIHDLKITTVKEVAGKYRLGDVNLELDGDKLIFGDEGSLTLLTGAKKDGKGLVEYVSSRSG